jgi:hypothetical protein
MTSYFDNFGQRVFAAQGDLHTALRALEEEIVFDCTVAIELPGFPEDLRARGHGIMLQYGYETLPSGAPCPDLDTVEDYRRRLGALASALHDLFHDYAARGGSDQPRNRVRAYYEAGYERRAQAFAVDRPEEQDP